MLTPPDPEVEATSSGAPAGFLVNVNIVFLSQIAIYGLAFALRVVLAQGLGDSGLGTYSLFFVAVLVAGGVANLGVGLGNIYFLNKGDYAYSTLLSGSLFVLLVSTALAWAAVGAWGLVVGDDLFVEGSAFWWYAGALPAVVAYVLLTSFLHGESRFLALSSVAVVQGLTGVAVAGAFYAAGNLDVLGAIVAFTSSFVVADIVCFAVVAAGRLDARAILRPDFAVLKEQIRYGAKGQVANLAQLFNYRLDQFLVAAFVSRAGVGHYTVAVGLSESVWWISSAVAMVLLPRLTGMDKERAGEVTPVICRNTLAVSIVAGIGLVAVSPLAIRILFGEEFDPSFLPLVLLMPGIIAASATRVLGSYLFSQGHIIYNTYATFIALGVTLALDFALIPWLEVEGAAIASSIAYTCSLVGTLIWYRKVSGGSIRNALVMRRSDTEMYAGVLRRVLGRASKTGDETA
ncbi:MAG TPA: oligosaccharide flippase family protein [Dehalococcoidia bacterium]|nr:oligosaccharide flippase family protein [Dehalococcoidia bacterium]